MIDTIRLFTKDFDLNSKNKFVLAQSVALESGAILSEKTFCNTEHCQMDIKQDGALYFKTSLPKLIYGTSLKEVQERDFDKCLAGMNKELDLAGVNIDKHSLENFRVSRLDYCRNVQVDYAIQDYISLFNTCSYGRRSRSNWSHETVTFFNGAQEFTVYNKIKELKQDKHAGKWQAKAQTMQENILRFESRLKGSRSVEQVLKTAMPTFEQVFHSDLSKAKLINDLKKVTAINEQLTLNFDNDLDLLHDLASQSTRNVWYKFIGLKGIDSFLFTYQYDFELIKTLLNNFFKKRQVYYILKDLKVHQQRARTKEQRNLIQEVQLKLAA